MTHETPTVLRITRRLDASPERVFDAWANPAWLFASADGEATTEVDARPGGKWTITSRRDGMDFTATGEYLEVDRPRRLVYTFGMPQFSPNSDTITIEIAPEGAGCVVTFTQEGVDIAEELRQLPPGEKGGTEAGWSQGFDALAAMLAQSQE
jgi:uncharacterized protein YndB with AHSA1/START domain